MKKMIRTGLATGCLWMYTSGISQATNLIITGVLDGPLAGGTPKAVELYTVSPIADLSQYGLGFANNGGGSDGMEFTFPNISVGGGEFFYVASESDKFTDFFGFGPDFTTTAANINGDDAVELFEAGSVIDIFGVADRDGTGEPWEYLDGWGYRASGPAGAATGIFTLSAWFFSGPNGLDGETSNLTATDPFPAGTYALSSPPQPVPTPEPASILLLGVGLSALAGAGCKRRA